MGQYYLLLSYVLGNFRDSAMNGRAVDLAVELSLAKSIFEFIEVNTPNQCDLERTISDYAEEGKCLRCLFSDYRANMLRSLLSDSGELLPIPPSRAVELESEFLRIGFRRLELLLTKGQVEYCYIEADHLHNAPRRLTLSYVSELQYYWDVERPLMLQRVSKFADELSELDPIPDYTIIWESMLSFLLAA